MHPFFALQDELVHTRQLRAEGLSRQDVHRLIRAKVLERVVTNVLRRPGPPLTERQMLRAVSLWGGEGTALSYQSAAYVWGMDGFRATPVHVSSPRRPRPPEAQFEIVVHPNVRLEPHDVTTRRGLRVTGGARTVLDLASVLDHAPFERAVDAALRAGATTRYFLVKCLKYKTRTGQTGIPKLRALVERRGATLIGTGSPLETAFLLLFKEQGLPAPAPQLDFPLIDALKQNRKVDFAWEDARLAVEIESFTYHRSRSAWANDMSKHNALVSAGWRVLRLTVEHLARPEETAALLRRSLARPEKDLAE